MRLLGVNRSGAEYACVQGWGFFDGPVDKPSIAAMASWRIDAVRVPLNEDCWLGINGVKRQYAGTAYRRAIEAYVARLHAAGIVAVLDLHWNAPGRRRATGQQPMPDADHSIAFWRSVAGAFKSDGDVLFDLYNEPHDISWRCWRDGCTTASGWRAAGMQQLLNAIRRAGATQPVMVAGLQWAGDLTGWLRHAPSDPLHQLVASAHTYNFSACNSAMCWNQTIAPVAKSVPVVAGEIGENDCASGFIETYMRWADRHGVSYLGWTWDTWNCRSGPALISSYAGTPTAYGAGFKRHLAALTRGGGGRRPPRGAVSNRTAWASSPTNDRVRRGTAASSRSRFRVSSCHPAAPRHAGGLAGAVCRLHGVRPRAGDRLASADPRRTPRALLVEAGRDPARGRRRVRRRSPGYGDLGPLELVDTRR
jgi:hypothetical protein